MIKKGKRYLTYAGAAFGGSGNPGGGPAGTPLIIYNTLVVSENGNNATAQRNNWNKEYLTIEAALVDAVSGDTILVFPGTYTYVSNLAKDGITIICFGNVVINNATASGTFLANSFATGFSLLGSATINQTAGSGGDAIIHIKDSIVPVTLEFNQVNNVTGTGGIYIQGDYTDNPNLVQIKGTIKTSNGFGLKFSGAGENTLSVFCDIDVDDRSDAVINGLLADQPGLNLTFNGNITIRNAPSDNGSLAVNIVNASTAIFNGIVKDYNSALTFIYANSGLASVTILLSIGGTEYFINPNNSTLIGGMEATANEIDFNLTTSLNWLGIASLKLATTLDTITNGRYTSKFITLSSGAAFLGGVLVVGQWYRIDTVVPGDDFDNVGYVSDGVPFEATGTVPTTWSNGTVVYGGLVIDPDTATNINLEAASPIIRLFKNDNIVLEYNANEDAYYQYNLSQFE